MVNERAAYYGGLDRRRLIAAAGVSIMLWTFLVALVDAEELDRSKLREPVFRVSKSSLPTSESPLAGGTGALIDAANLAVAEAANLAVVADAHPLDSALSMARESLLHIEQNVSDYTCTLVKRERVQGELLEYEFMSCKIRHPRAGDAVPFGVYLNFLKPDGVRGREVLYVEGQNDGKMVAHEGGLKGRFLPTVSLLPTSSLAMRGNRYPITEIGIQTLTRRLIEKGERDRKCGACDVRVVDGAKVRNRVCTMFEVKHHEQKPQYDFHLARVFLDKELNLPIRYEAYGWPPQTGVAPPLIEEYTYMDVRINVGLTDADFDTRNAGYRF